MKTIEKLIEKGVRIANPASIEIGPEVDVQRISGDNVVIYPGCRIYGKDTLILQGARLGYEAPVTVQNCWIGPDVELKGGFFQGAVFLKGAKLGLGSHVREATILEEQASIAHTVGLKHTILLPFVTLGSLRPRVPKGDFQKDPLNLVTVPAVSRKLHVKLLKNYDTARQLAE
jgi:UDP-N-acetylglucosamine/UDP-N-acetylgalactosamine diphosphorylase